MTEKVIKFRIIIRRRCYGEKLVPKILRDKKG